MTRDEIFSKVRAILVDELAVDEDEVTPESSLIKDLGAESIDFLAISFKLEQTFGIKIGDDELVPRGVLQDPRYVKEGRVTSEGLTALKGRMAHVDASAFAAIEKNPQVANVMNVFTVGHLTRFIENKLAAK